MTTPKAGSQQVKHGTGFNRFHAHTPHGSLPVDGGISRQLRVEGRKRRSEQRCHGLGWVGVVVGWEKADATSPEAARFGGRGQVRYSGREKSSLPAKNLSRHLFSLFRRIAHFAVVGVRSEARHTEALCRVTLIGLAAMATLE